TALPALVVRPGGLIPAITGGMTMAHECNGVELLRGLGAAAKKSFVLLSVSTQPLLLRWMEVVLLGPTAAPLPSKPFAVATPTKSTMVGPVEFAPVKAVVFATKATLNAVPLIGMIPAVSGVGK